MMMMWRRRRYHENPPYGWKLRRIPTMHNERAMYFKTNVFLYIYIFYRYGRFVEFATLEWKLSMTLL